MLALLLLLSTAIGAYWWATDPARMRHMAESYLSDLIGGQVHVGQASLSIFEGLKLSHVTVKVDDSNSPDAVLFVADAFDLQYDPATLLRGRLEATRIIVTGPHVHLVENVDDGRWNYQRLTPRIEKRPATRPGAEPGKRLLLPEVVLRNAQVEYSEIHGGHFISRGMMAIEGRLSPSPDGSRYSFELQSRGIMEGVGPVVSGSARLDNGQVTATLTNFRFGRDIEAMLPSEVRDWWQSHQLEGGLNIPDFRYTPAVHGRRASFHLETRLQHVQLVVRPQELADREGIARLETKRQSVELFRRIGLDLAGQASELEAMWTPLPIAVQDVSGHFVFDDAGITFDKVFGKIEGNTLAINGKIDGYTPDAPFHIRIGSPPGQPVHIPVNLKEAAAMPDDARNIYNMFKPHGVFDLWFGLDRLAPGSRPQLSGEINVIDASFISVFFPYPMEHASGNVVFGRKPDGSFEHVEIHNLRGHGPAGGPNEHAVFTVNGWVGPFDDKVGCHIEAQSDEISSEPALFAALPPEAKDALKIFGGGEGLDKRAEVRGQRSENAQASRSASSLTPKPQTLTPILHFRGGFVCNVDMPIGIGTEPVVSVDIHLADAGGQLTAFPYPLRHLSGTLKVREGYLDVIGMKMKHGDGSLRVDGRVTWPTKKSPDPAAGVQPDLKVIAANVPIDDDLLNALPSDKREWIQKFGLAGKLDVDGKISSRMDPSLFMVPADPSGIVYAVNVRLHDGSAHPIGQTFALTGIAGQLHITPDHLDVTDLRAHRAAADISANGRVDWSTDSPQVRLNATAKNLALDDSLYHMLPTVARNAWDAVDPYGSLDAGLTYQGPFGDDFTTNTPGSEVLRRAGSASEESGSSAYLRTRREQQPQAASGTYVLTLRPQHLTVTPKMLPYRLDDCAGSVVVKPGRVTLTKITAKHGDATLGVSGVGITGDRASWDLSLLANDVPMDAELAKSLPPAVGHLMHDLGLKGNITLDLKRFQYRDGINPNDSPDIDLAGKLLTSNGSMEVSVPMAALAGGLTFDASLRRGTLNEFHAKADFDSLMLAGRPVRRLKADLIKPAGTESMRIGNIEGDLAGGQFAGTINLAFPDAGPSTYRMNVVLKNADVRTVGGLGPDIRGQLSASLAMEGDWTDVSTRRGRGDVLVSGKSMVQIPLLLGLFEVTNLSLPSASPFNEATARYAVEGQRVTFDQIQMRSDSLVMDGSGYLDFGTKKVRLNFSTDNPNMPKLPFIHDLWQGAKQELFQIQVRGSVKAPKVSAASLHTFTTTVDEVFSGNGTEK
jgi:hypothetical protein